MNTIFLINLASGSGAGRRLAARITGKSTVSAIDFANLSAQLQDAARFDQIVVAGGDGTISSVISHPDFPERPAALIPLGTANDLCRELGISRALRSVRYNQIPEAILTWTAHPLAIWIVTLNGATIPMCNYCSIGFEGAVVGSFEAWRRQTRLKSRQANRVSYFFMGLKHLGIRVPRATLSHAQGTYRFTNPSMSVIISNIQSYLGITTCNRISDSADNRLEYVQLRSPIDYLQMVAAGSANVRHGGSIEGPIILDEMPSGTPVQIDGEYVGDTNGTPLTITFNRFVQILRPTPA